MTTAEQAQTNGHGDYAAFLASKRLVAPSGGLEVPAEADELDLFHAEDRAEG